MQNTQDGRLTVANILTIMACALAAVGFVKTEIGIPAELAPFMPGARVASLIAIHACFSWRLTKALGRFLELRRGSWKRRAAGTLAAFYFGVDVWLVHSGLGWIFEGWMELALYAASAGFTAVNLLGDWIEREDEQPAETKPLERPAAPPVSQETEDLLIRLDEVKKRMAQQR